jgi:predicted  nucleic acid-binding Zn-ribbon protein
MKEKFEVWEHKCFRCGHTNLFLVGGGADIICHGCWNYGMNYKGRKMATALEIKQSMFPGDFDNEKGT